MCVAVCRNTLRDTPRASLEACGTHPELASGNTQDKHPAPTAQKIHGCIRSRISKERRHTKAVSDNNLGSDHVQPLLWNEDILRIWSNV